MLFSETYSPSSQGENHAYLTQCSGVEIGVCGSLNENVPHRLIGSSTIRAMALLEELSSGVGFQVSGALARSSVALPADRCRTLGFFSSSMSA